MINIKSVLGTIGATIITIISIFFYGKSKGSKEKESEILKTGVNDALETKKKEHDRRNDSIDERVKRMREYSGK